MGGGHSTFDPRSPAPADGTFQRTPIVSVRGRLRHYLSLVVLSLFLFAYNI